MVDITHKSNTLRIAVAQASVKLGSINTINAIKNNQVPKGNVFEMSKAAGLLAVKQTPNLLPDCHPIPIEYTGIDFEIEDITINIRVTVKTIYKTGVEVEAMTAASIVALNIYDMLKPIDKQIEIQSVKLVQKMGGKSQFKSKFNYSELKASIIVCSDGISQNLREDSSGKLIYQYLRELGLLTKAPEIVADDHTEIKEMVLKLCKNSDLLILTGGTGLSERDVTPEVLLPLLDRRIDGVEETIRRYGQERIPFAMLSRSVVGTINSCLVIALPGSAKGVKESLDAIFPHILHYFFVQTGALHE